jgi:hypothetical protein
VRGRGRVHLSPPDSAAEAVRESEAADSLNAETQNINVPGMLFLPADGMLPAKLRDEEPKL